MADHDPQPRRRRVNLVGILIALVFAAVASVGFTGDPFWLFNQGTKWIAAGVLGLIGLGLVATSLPGLRRNS